MVSNLYRTFRRTIDEDGMLVSSTGFLVDSMLRDIDFSRPLRILEPGSGKGPMTREILPRMSPDSRLDICEIQSRYNPYIERLMAAHPDKQANLHNGCVTELLDGSRKYDVIVSSLPLRTFTRFTDGEAFVERVLECFRDSLEAGGLYMQYQYFRSNQDDIERVFGKPVDKVRFVPLNIPPAFVYRMVK